MKTLLITGFGTSISVDKRKLIVNNKPDNVKLEFYPHKIPYDTVIIDGNYGMITFEAMRWLAKHDIQLITLNWNGNMLSVTLPKEPISGRLKIKQYEKYLNPIEKHKIASAILDEKIRKSFDLLNKLSYYYNFIDKITLLQTFDDVKTKFKHSNELLTYEGNIAIIYWNELQKVFNKLYPSFNFSGRNSRRHSWNMNASDETNALLNYGYAILESIVKKAINSIGFEPSIAFLHELDDSRASLIYDIQELYRWLVDLSVIQLLEEKKLKKSDFIVTENYNIRLSASVAKALLDKIMLNFNKTAQYKGKNHSYEFILYDNVRTLANYIIDDTKTLSFNVPEIEVNRDDVSELRDKILQITPSERKSLAINKSTLWYIQNNVKNGKRIKVYSKVMNKIK
jgi:CRISPR-associated protein Cas1